MQLLLMIHRDTKMSVTEPELSRETIKSIKEARARISKGNFLTEEDAKKRLGL